MCSTCAAAPATGSPTIRITTSFARTAARSPRSRPPVDPLWSIYRECFAVAPWHESTEELHGFPARLAQHTSHAGAYGFVARQDTEIAGAVYGWPAPELLADDGPFDRAVRAAATPAVAANLVAPAVVVTELMVAAAHRRRGLGRALLRRLVAGTPRAWLATHPDADAVGLYESEGWSWQASFQLGDHPSALYIRESLNGKRCVVGR